MWFGRVATSECQEGSVLAHSTHVAGARIPKGTPLTSAHLRQLREAGVHELCVAVLGPADVDEDTAADRLARGLAGQGVALSRALTGRCNLHATQRGLVVLDEARLRQLNQTDWRLTVATVAQHRLVEAGEAVATVKVIPFAVDATTLRQAETLASEPGALLRVAPLKPHSAALVLSGGSAGSDRIRERTIAAQRARLTALGSRIDLVEICEHSTQSVSEALERCAKAGHSPILFIGASAVVDSADVFPAAVERVGGEVLHIGMPVDPGNLLVVARYGDRSLFGVPGCARTLRPSGFDTVLRAQLAGVPLGPTQLMDLGLGGLLESAAGHGSRPSPPDETRGVAAIVLAAGEGRRMPGAPKVLRTLQPGGPPLLRRVVDRLQAAQVSPIVVVTGHAAADVRAALSGTSARVAHNPDYRSGMGSSVATGARAIDDVDSVLVVLADMPDLEPDVVRALITAWRAGPHGIVAPVHGDRRGHPVLFDTTHLGRLRACSGDVGARALLEEHPVHLVEVDSPGVLLDLDTSEDLHARRRAEGPHG